MRRAASTLVVLSLLLCPASARAQQAFDAQRLAREIAQLPEQLAARVANLIRKAEGKGIELTRARYEYVPDVELSDPAPENDGATLGIDGFSARVIVPVPLTEETAVAGAVSFDTITLRNEGFAGAFPAKRLYEVHTRAGLLQRVSERWRLQGGVDVGMLSDAGSDVADVSLDDFQLALLVMFDYHLSEAVVVGVGAGYSTTFGLPLPLPAARASVEVGDFELSATLPSKVSAAWSPHRRVELGLQASFSGGEYHLRRADEFLSITTLSVGPYAIFETVRGLHLGVELGLLPWRRVRLDDSDGDEIENFDPAPTWFLRTEVAFQL